MLYEAAIGKEFAVIEHHDRPALADAVARYQHRLYRYLFRLTRDSAAAEDLFQQTWLNAARQIGRFDGRSSFDTWLFAIAHNAAMDLLRRKTGESLDDYEHALPSTGPDGLKAAIASERAAILDAQMGALPAVFREALTLRFEEGMKLEEIAAVTQAPLSTVKSRLHRGLESLRRGMTGRWRKEDLL